MSKWSYIELVRAITCTFMQGFQNNFAQLLSLRSESAVRNICSRRLKVKVTFALLLLLLCCFMSTVNI